MVCQFVLAANKRSRLEAGLSTGEVELNKMLSESENKTSVDKTPSPTLILENRNVPEQ